MENEMIAMPSVVLLIIGTAFLSAVVTAALPSLPNYWNALKNSIRRVFTRKQPEMDIVDVYLISDLQEQIDELEKQVNNVAANSYRRETNRKNNIRREVRDYLKELQK